MTDYKKKFRVARTTHVVLVMLLMLSGIGSVGATDPAPFVLTVVPRVPAPVTHRSWIPFTERLARDISHPIELKVFNVFSEFEEFVYSGHADLMFINPYQQVILKNRIGSVPLIRDDAERLSGALVVRADDSIQSLKDLEGQIVAFPHPNAFGASLYMRALLSEEFGIRIVPTYVNSHANVYRSVIMGKAKAGGGVNVTLDKEAPSVREKLRVIYKTPGVAPHPLSVHPRIAAEMRIRIVQAVLNMANDREGRDILRRITVTSPVRADYARDYQALEHLQLEKYYVVSDTPEH